MLNANPDLKDSVAEVALYDDFVAALMDLKLGGIDFRHSFASHLVNGGADIRTVQDMLGHESILTTEIYTHLDNSYLRDTITNFHPRAKKSRK